MATDGVSPVLQGHFVRTLGAFGGRFIYGSDNIVSVMDERRISGQFASMGSFMPPSEGMSGCVFRLWTVIRGPAVMDMAEQARIADYNVFIRAFFLFGCALLNLDGEGAFLFVHDEILDHVYDSYVRRVSYLYDALFHPDSGTIVPVATEVLRFIVGAFTAESIVFVAPVSGWQGVIDTARATAPGTVVWGPATMEPPPSWVNEVTLEAIRQAASFLRIRVIGRAEYDVFSTVEPRPSLSSAAVDYAANSDLPTF
jgi:hypothetical protein